MAFSNSDRVLIVDSDEKRAQNLSNLLQFIGLSSDTYTSSQLNDLESEFNQFTVIFVADQAAKDVFVDYNKQQKIHLPLIECVEKIGENKAPFYAQVSCKPDYAHLTQTIAMVKNMASHKAGLSDVVCFVGNSTPAEKINHLIEQVASTPASVLILGESGTGKEVVARRIHALSDRANKPFVPINCGAIPAELLESELFGHEKGAFTGAISARQGRFELAEGGVIFLDEIGDMPLSMQVKLLRVLQERCYERVGSNQTIQTDVRILAATHRNLEEHIKEGKFREDLFYRLNVFPIEVPSLKERADDVPLLINEIIQRIEHEGRGSVRFTQGALSMLMNYEWPGNVRELSNLVERMAILFPHGVVDSKDLPEKYISKDTALRGQQSENQILKVVEELPANGLNLRQYVIGIEKTFIEQALQRSNYVVARAATVLSMRRTTLVEKMKKYEIERDD